MIGKDRASVPLTRVGLRPLELRVTRRCAHDGTRSFHASGRPLHPMLYSSRQRPRKFIAYDRSSGPRHHRRARDRIRGPRTRRLERRRPRVGEPCRRRGGRRSCIHRPFPWPPCPTCVGTTRRPVPDSAARDRVATLATVDRLRRRRRGVPRWLCRRSRRCVATHQRARAAGARPPRLEPGGIRRHCDGLRHSIWRCQRRGPPASRGNAARHARTDDSRPHRRTA